MPAFALTRNTRTTVRWYVVVALLVFLVHARSQPILAQTVKVYVSSDSGDRLTSKAPLQFQLKTDGKSPAFQIDATVRYQTIGRDRSPAVPCRSDAFGVQPLGCRWPANRQAEACTPNTCKSAG